MRSKEEGTAVSLPAVFDLGCFHLGHAGGCWGWGGEERAEWGAEGSEVVAVVSEQSGFVEENQSRGVLWVRLAEF